MGCQETVEILLSMYPWKEANAIRALRDSSVFDATSPCMIDGLLCRSRRCLNKPDVSYLKTSLNKLVPLDSLLEIYEAVFFFCKAGSPPCAQALALYDKTFV